MEIGVMTKQTAMSKSIFGHCEPNKLPPLYIVLKPKSEEDIKWILDFVNNLIKAKDPNTMFTRRLVETHNIDIMDLPVIIEYDDNEFIHISLFRGPEAIVQKAWYKSDTFKAILGTASLFVSVAILFYLLLYK